MHRIRAKIEAGFFSGSKQVECRSQRRVKKVCDNRTTDDAIKYRARRMLLVLILGILCGCGSPEKSWELAEREDTNQAYLAFLAKYPEGELADRARARIIELKQQNAWERAEFRDRLDNYERFLERYPSGETAALARARIAQLQMEAAWETAQEEGSLESLQGFLDVYPDAPQSAQARDLIASIPIPQPEPELLPPPERAGEFRVQLGAFLTAAAADREVRRLSKHFGELLLGPIRIVTPAEHPGSRFLLKSVPMSGAEARGNCQALKKLGQDCFVINK